MGEEISWEIRQAAQDMYVVDGKTYDQVAEVVGVSVSQLKRWGAAEGWAESKREYREAISSIKRDKVRLRAGLLKKALGSNDAQDVYAFAALEKIEVSVKNKSGQDVPAPPLSKLKDIKTPADAVDALQEVIELKLNGLLHQPETLKLSQIRELKQTMELVESMRIKHAPEQDNGKKILSAERIKEIKEQLGL